MNRCFFLVSAILIAAMGHAAAEGLSGGPFRISYHENDLETARTALRILQEAAREFDPLLSMGDAPVHVVIAHTFDEFLRYAERFSQVTVSGVARAEQGLIVVKAPPLRRPGDDFAGTLRHEFVHLLLHRNSNTAELPHWLNEGICMSLANEYYWAAPLQMAKMFLANRLIEYRNLDYAFLAPGNEMKFGDAYAQALSMTRFLRNHLGEDRFWAVVHGVREMSFPDALRQFGGLSPQEFWQAYRRSLWAVAILGTMASGSFFTPAAFLLIAAYLRKRHKGQRILKRWAREEAAEDARDRFFVWEDVVEGPYDWELEKEEEEEDEPWRGV